MVGFCFLIALALTFIHSGLAAKWWVLFVLLFVALLIAIPEYLFKRRLLLAIAQLPYTFLLMTLNLFKLRGANKTFIHTSHGVDKPDAKNK